MPPKVYISLKILTFSIPYSKLYTSDQVSDTCEDIRRMGGDDLLDMDYFLNDDDLFDGEAGVEGFYIF